MTSPAVEAAAKAVLANFHPPSNLKPSWHLNPETVARAVLFATLPHLTEGLAGVIARIPTAPLMRVGGDAAEAIAATVIEHMRKQIEGEERRDE